MLLNKYPEFIEVDDTRYKIDTDFRTAMRCFEIIDDDNIDDYERTLAVIYLLLGDIPKNVEKTIQLLIRYLSMDRKAEPNEQPDMDVNSDMNYIISSFMSDYRIDLTEIEYMHWWHFNTLLSGLTNECILNRVREIRTCDLKDFKGKARTRMEKAKRELALPAKNKPSQSDMDAMDKFNALFNKEINDIDAEDSFLDGGD